MLYQLGTLTFSIQPVNLHEVDRTASADFAAKEVVGAFRPREFTGEGDDEMRLRGRIFPEHFGGLSGLDALHTMRRSGVAQILVRGDGTNLGWWHIVQVSERSTYLNASGVGKWIEFEVSLVRAAVPSATSYLSTLLRLLS